jgi:group II intron reverse transcriptase/maturase
MNIGEMQWKLSCWAEQDKEHKFFDLYHLLYDVEWLRLAHDYVSQNAGSITAGCDGINMKAFDENLDENLLNLAGELKTRTFKPQPVRRVYINEPGKKQRPLGIPSIRDRVVQEALRMILEPIYEADFDKYSYGFRPNRCTMDAIKCVTWYANERLKYLWVIEGDISSYFDTINHRKLVKILRKRIEDEKIIDLIQKFLRAGVMEGKLFRDTKLGTPQGGIISPLLANIYLNELDKYMDKYTKIPIREKTRRRDSGLSNYAFVRYADDFVVLCNGTKKQAEELKEELHQFLRDELRLTLSKEKTKLTHVKDGFKFLGFWITCERGGFGRNRPKVLIPRESIGKLNDKLSRVTAPFTHQDSVNSKIMALNSIYGGWCRYYQYTSRPHSDFRKIFEKIFFEFGHWLGRKHQISMPEVMRRYRRGNTLGTDICQLHNADNFPMLIWKRRFVKPNPYTTRVQVTREELPSETYWDGYEQNRRGMADMRPLILIRDGYICQLCDKPVKADTAEVDHIKPYRKFKRPVDANVPENLWTLCIPCHKEKTKSDQQMESRVR